MAVVNCGQYNHCQGVREDEKQLQNNGLRRTRNINWSLLLCSVK